MIWMVASFLTPNLEKLSGEKDDEFWICVLCVGESSGEVQQAVSYMGGVFSEEVIGRIGWKLKTRDGIAKRQCVE